MDVKVVGKVYATSMKSGVTLALKYKVHRVQILVKQMTNSHLYDTIYRLEQCGGPDKGSSDKGSQFNPYHLTNGTVLVET
jgi:hypothetical protein